MMNLLRPPSHPTTSKPRAGWREPPIAPVAVGMTAIPVSWKIREFEQATSEEIVILSKYETDPN
jgi:hypothetical protein